MAKDRQSTTIYKMRIGTQMSLDRAEKAFFRASEKATLAKGAKSRDAELARIDILKGETFIFYRGDKTVAESLKMNLTKKSPKNKIKITKTTDAALAKAP